MSVYVGEIFEHNKSQNTLCAYLTADTERELVDFAVHQLNLMPCWMHSDDIGPYFLISSHKRKLAIKKRAFPLRGVRR